MEAFNITEVEARIDLENQHVWLIFRNLGNNFAEAELHVTGAIVYAEHKIVLENLQRRIFNNKQGGFFEAIKMALKQDPIPDGTKQVITRGINEIYVKWLKNLVKEPQEKTSEYESAPMVKLEEFSPAVIKKVEAEAVRLLESSKAIVGIKEHLDNLITGEDENKMLLFTLALSGKIQSPKKKTFACSVQDAGAGKTWMISVISSLFKCHEVSHLTRKALNYIRDNIAGKEILYIKELGYLDKEDDSNGNASIKMLSIEDGGLVTTYTYRGDDGKFATETVKTDPITIFTSTTRTDLDPQFVRRAFIISPDSSEEQTKRIVEFNSKKKYQENQKKLGKREYTDFEFSYLVLQKYVQSFEPTEVLIPFDVYGILNLGNLRVRGDLKKLDILVELYAQLDKNNLDNLVTLDDMYHVMKPIQALEALKIAKKSLTYMSHGTDARIYTVLQILKDIERERGVEFKIYKGLPANYTEMNGSITPDIQYEIASKLGKHIETVRNWLRALGPYGIYEREGKPKCFFLTKSIETVIVALGGYENLEDGEQFTSLGEELTAKGNKFFEENGFKYRYQPFSKQKLLYEKSSRGGRDTQMCTSSTEEQNFGEQVRSFDVK